MSYLPLKARALLGSSLLLSVFATLQLLFRRSWAVSFHRPVVDPGELWVPRLGETAATAVGHSTA